MGWMGWMGHPIIKNKEQRKRRVQRSEPKRRKRRKSRKREIHRKEGMKKRHIDKKLSSAAEGSSAANSAHFEGDIVLFEAASARSWRRHLL